MIRFLIVTLFFISFFKVAIADTITAMNFAKTSYQLSSGDTISINPIFTPSNSRSNVSYTSSNTSISRVVYANSDGSVVIAALFFGFVTITGITEDGMFEDYAIVNVTGPLAFDEYPVQKIAVNPDRAILNSGDTLTLSVNVSPENATMKNILFSTSNFGVVSIVANSSPTSVVIGALFSGIATITAMSMDGGYTSFAVITVTGVKPQVIVPVTGISISPQNSIILSGDSLFIRATVQPSNATMQNVYFSTSNSRVARVALSPSNNSIVISALFPGVVTLTAKSMHGNFISRSVVTVNGLSFGFDTSYFKQFPSMVIANGKAEKVNNSFLIYWPTLAGASFYCLQYGIDSEFSNPSATVCGIANSNFEINGFPFASSLKVANADTLFWKAAIADANSRLYWSDVLKYRFGTVTSILDEKNSEFSVYPNPATNKLNIKGISEGVEVSIFHLSSSSVLEGRTPMVDISTLADGLYFVKIGNQYLKFFKE